MVGLRAEQRYRAPETGHGSLVMPLRLTRNSDFCVAATQLDKTKVLWLKYPPQWLRRYKDTKNQ